MLTVSQPRRDRGFVFAEVHDGDGKYVGRVVQVGGTSGGTWRPDAALLKSLGERPPTWKSYEAAKVALEGGE